MKILVQKFGGTSVSTSDRRKLVLKKVKQAISCGYSPVVVVSAIGRLGEPYATDSLLNLVDNDFRKNNHMPIDLLMSCGEIISTVVMCSELISDGIDSVPLTGGQAGIITDDNFGNASVIKVDTKNILNLLSKSIVPVVAGFQGMSKDGRITTLGRGGSDVTASLLGAALKSKKIEIYKDVDGIMTADPRLVKDATLIKEMNYNDVFQFADQGAKVIHPRAVEIAMRANIPLVIKNTFTSSEGTLIDSTKESDSKKIITGITYMNKRVQVKVFRKDNESNQNLYSLFDFLAKNEISIDLINVFPEGNIFTIDEDKLSKLEKIMSSINLKYKCIKDCTKISLIGSAMSGRPGIMSRILSVLRKENVEVLQTADSHNTIWCLVNSENIKKALNVLHREFNL